MRPCEIYLDEYQECKSFRGRFHQKYTSGKESDCSKWKDNYDNCLEYRKTRSSEVATRIIENELERRQERLTAARNNDVWKYRTSPPDDWSKPLPDNTGRVKLPTVNDDRARCTIL